MLISKSTFGQIGFDKEQADYEKKCAIICEEYTEYLRLFEADLHVLYPKTIKCHLQNIDFFS